jgi:hypothetical protein
MRKLIVLLSLVAFVSLVPIAFALDANRDAMRQPWRDQVNLQKQAARIEGLMPGTLTGTPGFTKSDTPLKLRSRGCAVCDARQF